MALRWLKVRVDLVRGRGEDLESWPGRVMLVPPEATFDDFGLGVDLAFGRWDVTPGRSFRVLPRGRHETKRGAAVQANQVVREVVGTADRFEYVFDDDAQWVHECVVEEFAVRRDTKGLAPIPVPVFGWGVIPDQYGRLHAGDTVGAASDENGHADADADAFETFDELAEADADAGSSRSERRGRDSLVALDMAEVRRAVSGLDAKQLLAALDGRELSPALQQVGDGLTRLYRTSGNGPVVQAELASALRDVETLLGQRAWLGDDVLAEEIAALLNGSERRGRTLSVDIADLADVMSSGGDDPGGYLHLDTGEVVHAFLHHGVDDYSPDDFSGDDFSDGPPVDESAELAEGEEPEDNLWIYVDHDDAGFDDMAAFTKAVPGHYAGILSVSIRGKGGFPRFRRTVDELGLGHDWAVFAEDRRWGRARALLKSQGIRPV